MNSYFSGFAMLTSIPIQYYITDFLNNMIFVFDANWNLIMNRSFQKPANIITVGTSLYITSDSIISRTDRNLNVLSQYIASGIVPQYRGIVYNSTNNVIYVVAHFTSTVHTFNLNPTLTSSLVVSPMSSYIYSISILNNQWYVGTRAGTIMVIFNNQITKQFNACAGNSEFIYSILFDGFGKMATACDNRQVYFYDSNGVNLLKSFLVSNNPLDIGFDSNLKFYVIAISKIEIYF